jgi:coenzyme F420 biosynthesis associated uncharacterized protein
VIDWIVAERIAAIVAGRGEAQAPKADLAALAALSQSRVVAYTGLEPDRALPPPEGVGRREWVASNIRSMRALLDPVLERTAKGLGPLGPAVALALGATLSAEVGIVLGYLGQRVLGQYELVLLDDPEVEQAPRLLFVLPNLGQAVSALEANEQEFVTWVTLHEVTHAVQFAGVPWLHGHLAGLVRELLRSAELRIEEPRRLRVPSIEALRRGAEALRRGDLIALVTNEAERETLDRVQAVMAVIEGHAEHVMDAVAPDLLPSLEKLRSALDRRRRTQSLLSRILARMLGLELKLRQYERGKRFCDEVVARGGVQALRRVFESPEALPSLAEIEDPGAWLSRMTGGEGAAAA